MKTSTNNAPFGTAILGVKWNRIQFCGREARPSNNSFACKDGKFVAVVKDIVVAVTDSMPDADKIFVREVTKRYGRVVRN